MGGKRVHVMFQPRKKCANIHHGDDWISSLPDEILVVILSFLPLKEATRTSVLSSRWIDLWKYTPCLIFDGYGALVDIANYNKPKTLNVQRRKYVNWVNSVLRSHKGFTLNEFIIDFDLDKFSQKAITKWLEFAFATRVESLELELRQYGSRSSEKLYVFPEKLINSSCGLSKTLKALCLKSVNVTDQAIDCFLRNFPLLEQLIVHYASKLFNIEVSGLSRMLKHLEICCCFRLRSIKVSAPSLTSLIITAVEELTLANVPMLANLFITCVGQHYLKKLVPTLSCCSSQLEILQLNLLNPEDIIELGELPELTKLKRLQIEWYSSRNQSILELAYFVRASPYLEEFVLKLGWCKCARKYRKIENAMQFPQQHLKVVEFVGYYGCPGDNELIRFMLENCVALEKIIIDPCCDDKTPTRCHPEKLEMEQTARECAKQQFQAEVPKHIQLVIR